MKTHRIIKGASVNDTNLPIVPTDKEISVLRRLAEKVRASAEHPRTLERRRRWRLLHELKAERPLILSESCWHESRVEPLVCDHPLLRSWEDWLRQTIYRFYVVDDDALVWPEFPVAWQVRIHDSHRGHDLPRDYSKGTEGVHGYGYVPLIRDISRLQEEVRRLPHERMEVDRDATHQQLDLAAEIFGSILPPRLSFRPANLWWTLALAYDAVHLVGFTEFLRSLCENPDGLHALMAFLQHYRMMNLDFIERKGLLTTFWNSDNGLGDVTPSGNSTPTDEKARLADQWGFAECQEMIMASPKMFEEFILPYLTPITGRFGYISYGCCEPLDDRLDIVRRHLPNVRKIGVSAWANQECYVGVGSSLVLSRRPNPAMVCTRFNEDEIRDDMRKTLDILGHCQLELVMKDVETVQNDPQRIPRWVQIVREEIARHYPDL